MYCKLYASLYQGTLRGRAHDILVFTNLLAHADREGYVDKHWKAIAEEVGLTIDDVKAACERLEGPDIESRSQELHGARLERIDDHRAWGWRIVNYVKYRTLRDEDERRLQNRKAQAKRREKLGLSQQVSASVSQSQTESAHAEVEGDAESEAEEDVCVSGKADPQMFESTEKARKELNRMYNRSDSSTWNYLEESLLCEVVRRGSFDGELAELKVYRGRCGKFFPRSIRSLLEKWNETLDQARTKQKEKESKI